jgi:hypothetical protein
LYGGDSNFAGSKSKAVSQAVNKATTKRGGQVRFVTTTAAPPQSMLTHNPVVKHRLQP